MENVVEYWEYAEEVLGLCSGTCTTNVYLDCYSNISAKDISACGTSRNAELVVAAGNCLKLSILLLGLLTESLFPLFSRPVINILARGTFRTRLLREFFGLGELF